MSFTGFTWAFLGFTEFYWAVLGFTVLFPGLALASCRLGAYYRVSYLVFICFFLSSLSYQVTIYCRFRSLFKKEKKTGVRVEG